VLGRPGALLQRARLARRQAIRAHPQGIRPRYRDPAAAARRSWLAWCRSIGVDPVTGVTEDHVALYARTLDSAALSPANAARKLSAVSGWYAWLARRGPHRHEPGRRRRSARCRPRHVQHAGADPRPGPRPAGRRRPSPRAAACSYVRTRRRAPAHRGAGQRGCRRRRRGHLGSDRGALGAVGQAQRAASGKPSYCPPWLPSAWTWIQPSDLRFYQPEVDCCQAFLIA
jgi:Phage integrase, N-terminal SAM-like domain